MKNQSLITLKSPKSPEAEVYRRIKTNLKFFGIEKKVKTIVITSSKPNEGKTTTVANLGISLAQSNKKVVIVDCDLRKPSLHSLFGISNSIGLTSIFTGENTIEETIHTFAAVKNLDIITSGPIPPMPSEILESSLMDKMLNDLCDKYDYIIIDTPPVLNATDSSSISQKVDGVIITVGYKLVRIPELKKSIDILKKVNAKIFGTVFTKVNMKKIG